MLNPVTLFDKEQQNLIKIEKNIGVIIKMIAILQTLAAQCWLLQEKKFANKGI